VTTQETAGSRLLRLLQRLQEWSVTLDAIQIRILAEGIASFYRQMIDGLGIDESLLSEAPVPTGTDRLPPEALAQLAKIGRLCRAPRSFVEAHSADSLFESIIRQYELLCRRIELKLGVSSWQLYTALHELEARSRSMDVGQIVDAHRLISSIYLKILSSLRADEQRLEEVPVVLGWFEELSSEGRELAARLVAFCLNPAAYLDDRLPRGVRDDLLKQRLKLETRRVADFLLEVGTAAP
jgi:hypothetical protein